MKKAFLIFSLLSLLLPTISQAAPAEARLRGRILLQVESNGEAWYVRPVDGQRMYLKDGSAAYDLMRSEGLGISNLDLTKIPIGFEDRFECLDSDSDGLCDKLEDGIGTDKNKADTDGDSFNDGEEIKNNYSPLGPNKLSYNQALINRLKGKILLQVEQNGQAWYINPDNGKRYYMPDGAAAYQIMRFLSLGITNNNLTRIDIGGNLEDINVNDFNDNKNNDLVAYEASFGDFSFQYPKNNWIIDDSLSIVVRLNPTDPNEKVDENNYYSYISLQIDEYYEDKCNDLNSCADNYTNKFYGDKEVYSEKYIELDGKQALFQIIKDSRENDDVLVHYINNGFYYRFWLNSRPVNYDLYLGDLNIILSSFKSN